jgi:hypothetical protein
MKRSLLLLLLVCSLYVLAGCGGPPPPPPVATHLSVSAPATITAGTAFNVNVSALDSSNNVVAGYSGTVHFTSTDGQATLPADSTLTNGTRTFSVTLKTATGQTIAVSDKAALSGTSNAINVSAGPATRLSLSAPSAVTAGRAFILSVSVFDAFNNVATGYAGMLHFSSSDAQAVLPGNSALTNGMGTFSVALTTIANTTITATDTAAALLTTSSNTISVFSNAATHFVVTTPVSATTRAPITVQVTALDGANNISATYSGAVHFTSTDTQAVLPANSGLTNGLGAFSATLETAGNQSITTNDAVMTSVTGTSGSIGVTAAATLTITSGAPPSGTAQVNYGPFTTQNYRCVRNINGSFSCTPCSGVSGCTSLPLCGRFSASPCHETRQIFAGFTFTATGGIPPYNWSATGLPSMLSVNPTNGQITGTPTTAGTYTVAVTLTDSGTPKVTINPLSYSIVIKNPPPPVINTTPTPPAGVVNQPYSFTFTATGGLAPLGPWSESGALIPGFAAVSSAGVLSGTPTTAGPFSITLMVRDAAGQNSVPQAFTIQIAAHGFKATGNMATPRVAHTATLLTTGNDAGKVLVAGGNDASGHPVATAELYDPSTGTFSTTGSMAAARSNFAAALLSSGKVLVTGGLDATGNPLATAEIYDPSAGTFSPTTGNMTIARASHTATLLNTAPSAGKVLVAGWGNATAELFDPATGTFTATGSMATARVGHTATLLSSGKVLVAGGIQGVPPATTVLAEAELYDPSTGRFTPAAGSLATARYNHTATLLGTGKVLLTGGLGTTGSSIATAELFDPTSQSFTATTGSMGTTRAGHTATLLKDGTVLITGGDPPGAVVLATAEVYDPTAGTFSPTGSMGTAREFHTATLLSNGSVLVTGGTNGTALVTAELYQ